MNNQNNQLTDKLQKYSWFTKINYEIEKSNYKE